MHSNTCKSLQECENVLTDRIIVSSIGGKASTRMQPTETTDIAVNWGVVTEYRDIIWNNSSVLLDYIEFRTRRNQFEFSNNMKTVYPEWKPCCS